MIDFKKLHVCSVAWQRNGIVNAHGTSILLRLHTDAESLLGRQLSVCGGAQDL